MNNLWKKLCLSIALVGLTVAHAGVKVTGLNWVPQNDRGRFVVNVSGDGGEAPDWSTKGNRLSMVIPGAQIEKGMVRYVGGIRLAAANVNNGVLATLTFLNGGAINNDNISITLNDSKIEVTTIVPTGAKTMETAAAPAATPLISAKAAPTVTRRPGIMKSDLGEDFLKKLEAEDKAPAAVAAPVKVNGTTVAVPTASALSFKDEVKNSQASPARKSDSFSIATYAGKFVAFLGIVLLFFWGIVQMMKKGMLSKGKLGFLNGSSLVSVMSTTYVGPKRSLLLVKAHNQVFLVASSEAGFEFLSEVKDVPGIVKQGEKFITGQNFDDVAVRVDQDIEDRVETTKHVKLKEDIYQSIEEIVKPTSKLNKDMARFSDELKKKVKNLKAMQ